MRSSIAARSSWAVAYRSVVGENKWHGGNGQETDGGRGSVLHGTQPVACVGRCDRRAVKLRSTPRIAERRRRSAQAESALRSGACGPGRGTSRFCALRGTAGAEGPRARGPTAGVWRRRGQVPRRRCMADRAGRSSHPILAPLPSGARDQRS